ncbi:M23 family metallopeptidase [Rhodobacteraceae bacterium D3-12]|nr:M23 family metallopeptidase [Rhodobacteraceae bacterium D3-12]
MHGLTAYKPKPARSTPLRAGFLFLTLLALAIGPAPGHAELPAPKFAAPSTQNPPAFLLPVDCMIPATCYIQNFVDADPGPAARDFRCNPLSYDGHKGTDFALPTLADMARGVAVIAPAAGRVKGTRDGMDDGAYMTNPDSIKNRKCGNGLVIDHGNGWHTQYCHLRKGSLAVRTGQQVTPGTPLGLVGQSGFAEFPHLHFSVRFVAAPSTRSIPTGSMPAPPRQPQPSGKPARRPTCPAASCALASPLNAPTMTPSALARPAP